MVRRPVGGLAVAALCVLVGCRPATVSVGFSPAIGDRYAYRYEIHATITRDVQGRPPEVVHLDTELSARQEVQALTKGGARIRLVLTRDGGVPRTAVVLVDRAGSLEGIELVEGLDAAAFGVGGDDTLGPSHLTGPPDRPLAPGDRWTIREATRHGSGRLDRLGVVDGEDVAVVATSITDDVDEAGLAGTSSTHVTGALRTTATTSYDLRGGAIRRSRSHSSGRLDARLAPPAGVTARAVHATIGYDVTVRVTRTG
jgi:hypothetical protein